MSKSFKGLKCTLIFAIFCFVTAIIRILFQFKTRLSPFRMLSNTVLIFLTLYVAYKFYKGYKNYIVITDEKIIINKILKDKTININEISKIFYKNDMIILNTKSKKIIKILLFDISKEDTKALKATLLNLK